MNIDSLTVTNFKRLIDCNKFQTTLAFTHPRRSIDAPQTDIRRVLLFSGARQFKKS